ncbi:S8 family serine peptidase, partial [Candidatus Woesearchaeota archaeon]|nr:S8 family serine peptidase [Candidatus Woesearchaeota archaeon]
MGWDFHCQNATGIPPDTCSGHFNDPQHKILTLEYPHTHGSQMASIISAVTDNDPTGGMAGIAWKVKVMGVRCAESYTKFVDIFEGTQYAVDNGAHLLNMSFTIATPTEARDIAAFAMWHELIVRAREQAGILTITSADDADTSLAYAYERYPNVWPEVICVAAVDSSGKKTVKYGSRDGSNYGAAVDICAPAGGTRETSLQIVSCAYQPHAQPQYPGSIYPHHFWYTSIATSGACAEVTGILALLKSLYPDATPDFLESELKRGATPLNPSEQGQPWADSLGVGIVNAYRSLTQWGTLSESTTWSNTVYVSGDLTVASGKTLTINPGTVINIAGDDNEATGLDATRIEFNIEGYLDINGTAENPVVFQSWQSNGRDDWVGIKLWTGSTGGNLDHVIIKNAETGIKHAVPITVTNSTINNCEIGIESFDNLTLT